MKLGCCISSVILLSVLFFSCQGKEGNAKTAGPSENIQNGVVLDKVSCLAGVCSYALYLPPAYDSAKKWPVIFCFDPAGRGTVPLVLCREQAGKFGYILVGSNDTRNGLPYQTSLVIIESLIRDVRKRFSIDPARIQLMGFSGGSRLAGTAALSRSDIHAVIGCSAGLPTLETRPVRPFEYLGVSGQSDMNYLEMKVMCDRLKGTDYQHFLLVFDGKHSWPPDSVIPDIFNWLQLKAMKNRMIETDYHYVTEVLARLHRELVMARQAKDILQEEYVCLKALHFLEGFPQAHTFEEELATLRARLDYGPALKKRDAVLQIEQDAQLQFTADLLSKDLLFWKKEMGKLSAKKNAAATREEKDMYHRLAGFYSLSTYSAMNQAIQASAWEAATHYNKVYAIVDPENPEHAYVAAQLAMNKGEENVALRSLQKAVNLGFNDAGRMENDNSFAPLRGKPGFLEILNSLKNQ